MITKNSRESAAARKSQILAAAFNIAREEGLAQASQTAVAERLGVSRSLVINYYKIDELQNAVIEQAISENNLTILAHGIFARVPKALSAPKELKAKALKSFLS